MNRSIPSTPEPPARCSPRAVPPPPAAPSAQSAHPPQSLAPTHTPPTHAQVDPASSTHHQAKQTAPRAAYTTESVLSGTSDHEPCPHQASPSPASSPLRPPRVAHPRSAPSQASPRRAKPQHDPLRSSIHPHPKPSPQARSPAQGHASTPSHHTPTLGSSDLQAPQHAGTHPPPAPDPQAAYTHPQAQSKSQWTEAKPPRAAQKSPPHPQRHH